MKIETEGVWNARDLGGIPVAGGRKVKAGLLLRTGRLSEMTENDRKLLFETYHVTEILDLRSRHEIDEHPDPVIPGVKWVFNPIHPDQVPGITREDDGETDPVKQQLHWLQGMNGQAARIMEAMYGRMVKLPYCVEHLKLFFEHILSHGEGAVLWHCSAGKDRTGVTAALLLEMLGADRDDIFADYLLTNELLEPRHRTMYQQMLERLGDPALAEQAVVLDSVSEKYLGAVYAEMENSWGGVQGFIRNALGVTEEDCEALKSRYTEPA